MRQIIKKIGTDLYTIRWAIIFIIAYFVLIGTILPSTCPLYLLTGIPCPGCGMSRAFLSLLQLDFAGAFRMHPFVYAVAVLFLFFCLDRYIIKKDLSQVLFVLMIITACGMIVFYVWRMITQFPGDPPMNYYEGSLLCRVLTLLGYPF